ncbi:DinB family protein [Paucibacter sp. APW11]|uniref:DinB family protein n=1 Tax=Roseateles aquae TaxID=3077235 RepID=A0ABU3PH78_9BURK|nr:DinB family protein [Paucibacter sp. APW11]MDT9001462.1 DinB family protein [Paucibacter sp. APW11]
MSASALLLSLFKYKAWADEALFAEVAKIDGEAHASERHLAIRLLNHIHVVDRIFAAHLQAQPHGYTATNTVETPTLPDLLSEVGQTNVWFIDWLTSAAETELDQPVRFAFTDASPATMTRAEMLSHLITHGTYHRGAIGRILSQVGLTAPRDVFTGFLHESEPQRRG